MMVRGWRTGEINEEAEKERIHKKLILRNVSERVKDSRKRKSRESSLLKRLVDISKERNYSQKVERDGEKM